MVFHDELDLAPGKLKYKKGGGHAGHNGLRSMHQHLGEAYARVRMGIGHPGRKDLVSHYVLHDFHKMDQEWLDDMLARYFRRRGTSGRRRHGKVFQCSGSTSEPATVVKQQTQARNTAKAAKGQANAKAGS